MLHIITPLYRYENLPKVYASIPKHSDIMWHVAKTSHRMKIDLGHKTGAGTYAFDKRIRLYEIDCADTDTVAKYNAVFSRIKDGYFAFLDDDTVMVERLYDKYKELQDKKIIGMYIGDVQSRTGAKILKAEMPTAPPSIGTIAEGNVICHYSVLEEVKWTQPKIHQSEAVFWSDCASLLGTANVIVENEVISIYNALRNE